jgi:hypothetical protein
MPISEDQDRLERVLRQPFVVVGRGRVVRRKNRDKDDELGVAPALEELGRMDNAIKDMTEY